MKRIKKIFLWIGVCATIILGLFIGRISYDKIKEAFDNQKNCQAILNVNADISDWLSDNPQKYSTLEKTEEAETLNKYLSNAETYFEYGSGGSTFEALKHRNLQKVYSVENSVPWLYGYMYRFKFILDNIVEKRLDMIYVDTGDTGDWGYPLNWNINYTNYPEALLLKEEYKNADVFLVDGRYRVACLLQILNNAKDDAIVMLHDSQRLYYHEVYKYFDVIEYSGALAVFKIKQRPVAEEFAMLYDKYSKDVR